MRALTVDVAVTKDPKTGLMVATLHNDYGTPQRALRDGGIRLGARRQTTGGIVTGYGAIVAFENAIDRLIAAGAIGHGDDQRSRMFAVDWLRRIHAKAGLSRRLIGKYEPPSSASAGDPMFDPEKLFYRRQWNALFDELRADRARVVIRAVCFDEAVEPWTWAALREGLDQIVAWQGLRRTRR